MTMSKFPVCYKNGNYFVEILEDGTKNKYCDNNTNVLIPEYPETIDLKITEKCDLNCVFCHEESDDTGKRCEMDFVINLLKQLPYGVEIAIGGGNPLEHPHLIKLLKSKQNIFNLTVNNIHACYSCKLEKILDKQYINGLGISVDRSPNLTPKLKNYKNLVIHVIAGTHEIEYLNNFREFKVLILGFKFKGRGELMGNILNVPKKLITWKQEIGIYLKKQKLAFDNLAIEQLELKRFFKDETWDKYYLGDDGTHSMYIDAVRREYAKSSTSETRFKCGNKTIKEMFNNIRKENSKS